MNLHEELIRLQESSLVIREEVFVSDLSNPVITEKLNEVVDSLQSNPESIFQQNILDTLKSFLKYMQCLTDENICKLTDIILSAFNTMVNNIHNDIRMRETSSYQIDRLVLETYMFLWHYMVMQSENLWATRKNERAKKLSALGQKKKKVNLPITISLWDWNQTRIDIVSMSIMLVSLDLRALYEHTSDMDTVLRFLSANLNFALKI